MVVRLMMLAVVVGLAVFGLDAVVRAAVRPGDVAMLGVLGTSVIPPATPRVRNEPIVCAPSMSWNPDAGNAAGLIRPNMAVGKPGDVVDAGQFVMAEFRAHTGTGGGCTSTNPCFFCNRAGTTAANFQTACAKKCDTCIEGEEYISPRSLTLGGNAMCIRLNTTTDAGAVISVEMAE